MNTSTLQTLMRLYQTADGTRFTVHLKGGKRIFCRFISGHSGDLRDQYITVVNAAGKDDGFYVSQVESVEIHEE